MQITKILTAATVTAIIAATPAVALAGSAGKSGSAPGHHRTSTTTMTTTTGTGTTTTGTTTTTTAPPTSAYGKYCLRESRKHVAGTPGTPFSQCVSAIGKARAAQHKAHS